MGGGQGAGPVADGLLEAWGATNNLGLNIEALRMELLLVKATLELAASKQICGQAMEELLGKLRDSAHCAEDLLDELDYFRIHDELHGTCDAADHHAKGGVHDFALNARHTTKAVGKRVSCCAWPRARQRSNVNSSSEPKANQEGSHVSSSSEPKANQEVSGCMPKLEPPCRAAKAHQPQDIKGLLMSSRSVVAQGWPPQITARIRCLELRQHRVNTTVQGVSGNYPKNQTAISRLTQGLCLGVPLYILLAL